MSEKRFASKKLLRQLFGDEASYKQGKKEMIEWLEKYCEENKHVSGKYPYHWIDNEDLILAAKKSGR